MNRSYWHLAAWYDTRAGAVTNQPMATVNDGILTSQADYFLAPSEAELIFSAAGSAQMTNARLDTPSLREVGLPSLQPINLSAATIPSPVNVADFLLSPIRVPKVDQIAAQMTLSGAGTGYVIAGIGFGPRPPAPGGRIYRLRATSAITGAAGVWVNGALNFEQSLPAGYYAIVGMQTIAATVLAARLSIPGAAFRPGVIATNALGGQPWPRFQDGSLGVWGVFENQNVPSLDILTGLGGASTAQVTFLDVIKLDTARLP